MSAFIPSIASLTGWVPVDGIEAESVIRIDTLDPELRACLAAGELPLGAALARHGPIHPGAAQLATPDPREGRPRYARRAVLHVPGAADLLLTEVFLPALWRLIGAERGALA